MQHSKFKNLLDKYLNGKASKAQRYLVEIWYDSFEDTSIKRESSETIDKRKAAIFDKINQRLAQPAPWYHASWLKVAASITIVAVVGLLMVSRNEDQRQQVAIALPKETVFVTATRQMKKIILQDRTEVILNANSTLKVASDFGKQNRKVQLVGQAYFDVQRDTLKPFEITASDVKIQVLGTAFDVQAYPNAKHIDVAVTHGKVQVRDTSQVLGMLLAGKSIVYDKLKHTAILKDFTIQQSPWIVGKYPLVNASFDDLAQSFENLYGTKISTTSKAIKNFRYHLTLKSTQPEAAALAMIATIAKRKYRKEGRHGVILYE